MRTMVNKTFEEIALGDAVSVERTLQAGDVRAWAAAFGGLAWLLGAKLDEQANAFRRSPHLHPRQPRGGLDHPTNEELMIARHTMAIVHP